jgi:hypothetical protein
MSRTGKKTVSGLIKFTVVLDVCSFLAFLHTYTLICISTPFKRVQ